MIDELYKLAKFLRSEKGCPWDKSRKMSDYPPYLIDESKEIAKAIRKKDWKNLEEEIGDVLFNLLQLLAIAEEKASIKPKNMIKICAQKIKGRHTWVFGKDKGKVKTPEDAVRVWNENKRKK